LRKKKAIEMQGGGTEGGEDTSDSATFIKQQSEGLRKLHEKNVLRAPKNVKIKLTEKKRGGGIQNPQQIKIIWARSRPENVQNKIGEKQREGRR